MPKVPNDGPEPQPSAPPQAPQAFMLMAAAVMHEQGKLFKVKDNERFYIDENGQERSLNNDKTIDQFRPQITEMAKSLTDEQASTLHKYGHGPASLFTDKDRKVISPLLDQVQTITKDLPNSKQEGNEIRIYNWPNLFIDEVLRTHKAQKAGI